MVRFSRYPTKPGSVSLTLPVANYAATLSGVPATAQVTPSPAVALFRQTNCRSLRWKSLLRHWTPTRPVLISTGIDATQTNHGRQHLDETQVRVFGQHLMQGIYTTQDGRSDVAISCCCMVSGDVQQCYTAKERRLQQHTSAQLHAGETVTLQKLVWLDWRDDRQAVLDEWGSASLRQLEMCAQQSYDQLLAVSTENWRQ